MLDHFRWHCVFALFGCLAAYLPPARAEQPATAPATGELDLTFTQRSQLSARKDLAKRLSLKDSEIGDDYDLSQRPFKAYVPKNYDSSVPHGVFVYLGYKDSDSVAVNWEPLLDQSHLIFITPVCHHGSQFPNEVPTWQTLGLAFDAVDNLKRQYNVDPRRIYLMTFTDHGFQETLISGDVFTGYVVANPTAYFDKLVLPNKNYIPPDFPPPPAPLFRQAKQQAFVIVDEVDFSQLDGAPQLIVVTLKKSGFAHVMGQHAAMMDELHYPIFKPEWFQQTTLPFLDKFAAAPASKPATAPATPRPAPATGRPVPGASPPPVASPAPAATAPPPPAAPASDPEAQRLLRLAQLYIKNGQPNLARPKLEAVIEAYPRDPAAADARALLAKLPPQQ